VRVRRTASCDTVYNKLSCRGDTARRSVQNVLSRKTKTADVTLQMHTQVVFIQFLLNFHSVPVMNLNYLEWLWQVFKVTSLYYWAILLMLCLALPSTIRKTTFVCIVDVVDDPPLLSILPPSPALSMIWYYPPLTVLDQLLRNCILVTKYKSRCK